tara:strand:+ start:450 stop:884 length:435 start_codon:yes stop_codon:yes gene_type:complete
MIINKLENIETGIIELLLKKYNVDKYNENINSFKTNLINLDTIKERCNISEDNLNKYLEIDSKLCTYDIDILNLLIKYNNLYKKYKNEKIIQQKYTIIESIYYYFGYDIPKTKTIDLEYFIKKSKNININIKEIYLKLFTLFIK